MPRARLPLLLAIGVSLGLHGLAASRLSDALRVEVVESPQVSAIEFSALEPPASAPAHAPPASPRQAARPAMRAHRPARTSARDAASRPPSEPPPPEPSTAVAPPAMRRAPAAVDLSPAAAAASIAPWVSSAASGTCSRELSAADSAGECTTDTGAPTQVAERLQRELEALARHVPHLQREPPPELRRELDGSYHYRGTAFSARIDRDGSVKLTDDPVVSSALPIPIAGRFDLNDAVERLLGKELYPAEKRRFLERTASLRKELVERERERSFVAGRLRLLAELERIVGDPGARPEQRRAQVFELWDGCASDEDGGRGRRIIEAFVRERMPRGDPLGYSEEELTALNAGRASQRRFDPYAAEQSSAVAGRPG